MSVLAWVTAAIPFFVASQQEADMLGQALTYFGGAATLSALILLFVNRSELVRRPIVAFVVGVAVGTVASLTNTAAHIAPDNVGPDAAVFVFASVFSVNLVFIVALGIAQFAFAPAITTRVLAWRGPRRNRGIALVRLPASNLSDGLVSHVDRVPVSLELADAQWDNYCAALRAEGWAVLEVDAAPDLADSVFVEDMVVMFGSLAVLASPGAPSRVAEREGVERAVRSLPGIRVRSISAPGTLDGGDVLKVGSDVYVGSSSRTNGEGIRQLRAILEPEGYRVIAVPVSRVLHLKSAVTALPDGTIIGHPDLIDARMFDRFLAMPEVEGVAVVDLGRNTLLISAAAPQSAQLLADLGYRVIAVDISEFEKLEGCVTCLSVRVR
ncbi:MAG TPA: dimethylarginine dimethylaminohydrolase [Microbacteriaceae bacterium]|nr:dimethylarginine dimethylaminohydrolase [Microbacteriaceae bacterium]